MTKTSLSRIILILSVILITRNAYSQPSADWPSFHGADRSNRSQETGLLKSWPANGPKLLLTIPGIGEGYSSVTIADGLIYTAGIWSGQTCVFCFDMNGKPVWKKPNGQTWTTNLSWATSYTGSRSTPTWDKGVVYHLGEMGRLAAFKARTGEEIWSRDLPKEFETAAPEPEYGYSESVLVDGDRLYVCPYGKKGFIVCLDKTTGKTIWSCTEIPGTPGYNSLVLNETAGYRQVIGASSNCFYGVDVSTGKLLWKTEWINQRELNNTDAVIKGDLVFVSSGYGKGCGLVRIKATGGKIIPEKVWESELMDNIHGGVVLYNGYFYGAGSNSRGWFCLDLLTGKQAWKGDGKGSITYADGMLYLLDERGSMKLVKAAPEKYEQTGEFRVLKGGEGMYWAHPVVCGGRLYVRHADKVFVYDISARQ